MKYLVFIFLLLSTSWVYSQKNYSKSISLVTDNDLYTSTYRDRYYSNGLFVKFQYLGTTEANQIEKKIHSFEIGHLMYTPYKSTLIFPSSHDRPFAGVLFAQYGNHRYYKNEHIFSSQVQLGILGPSSKAKELQNYIHSIYGFPEAVGWKYQIKEALVLNLNLSYVHFLSRNSAGNFDISSYSKANLGTLFTDISTGLYLRFGFKSLQKNYETIGFQSNISKHKQKVKESFIFVKPMLGYYAYDATVSGSFLNDESPITFNTVPFQFSLAIGYRYAAKRFDYGYTYHLYTKKADNTKIDPTNNYGSIFIGYNFN
ncbi:hypothetical protein GCM10011416_23300 [Polaribacter pacificus]|uniref:Lipid A deacylase LpxR family protein n=1 Tax=Polaribacter pacificus TaxID=1775173 RepID=A0A917I2J0_9FLAO|nr:lipid A deacylase LpxR family protein [Polaribacter pacificus]GGH03635.1 hypothetical protein GCM10011416_23300 [Polaribacter pacificus]